MPKFSILTSAHLWSDLKAFQLERCVKSVENQTFTDWEMLLVDDGSPTPIRDFGNPKIRQFKLTHLERVIALNKALDESQGKWLAFLDSDDEYFSYSLELMNQMIEKNPDYKLFNCASLHVHKDWGTVIRGAFHPKEETVGHEVFGGGNIVNGTFFFHRSLYEELGCFPKGEKLWNPWDLSIYFQEEFPETKQFFMVDKENEPEKVARELGNPWGNDHASFYRYTRKYHSKAYDIPILIIHHDGREGKGHELKS